MTHEFKMAVLRLWIVNRIIEKYLVSVNFSRRVLTFLLYSSQFLILFEYYLFGRKTSKEFFEFSSSLGFKACCASFHVAIFTLYSCNFKEYTEKRIKKKIYRFENFGFNLFSGQTVQFMYQNFDRLHEAVAILLEWSLKLQDQGGKLIEVHEKL